MADDKMNGVGQEGMAEEDVVYLPIPKGRQYILFVFRTPGSVLADMASTPDIEAGQMDALGCYLRSRADWLLKRKFDHAAKSSIVVPR